MIASESVKRKIKEFEGLRLQAYRCAAGVLTIGYGHTGRDVKDGMEITSERADELFEQDVAEFEHILDASLDGLYLSQHRYDALLSFSYNVGIGALRKSTLYRKVCSNPSDPSIRGEFMRWTRAGGKVQQGLVRRREWEARRYFGEV